tara:strand:- start:1745 stop:1930 length:186 start_codon:yes stop_codon:yes gene_type:complete
MSIKKIKNMNNEMRDKLFVEAVKIQVSRASTPAERVAAGRVANEIAMQNLLDEILDNIGIN